MLDLEFELDRAWVGRLERSVGVAKVPQVSSLSSACRSVGLKLSD